MIVCSITLSVVRPSFLTVFSFTFVLSYYAIASKATLLKPVELAVPAQKFEGTRMINRHTIHSDYSLLSSVINSLYHRTRL